MPESPVHPSSLRPLLVSLACAGLASPLAALHAAPLPFQNPELPAEERITDLISRLTTEEKIDCLAMRAAVPRLGVKGSPHIEGYHGVAQGGPSNWGARNPTATTQFPQAYGLGATWDPELLRQVAAQEALEARYLYQSKKYDRSGLIVRAPNADLARDPRWGRTEEVFGEDPFHAGTLATAFVRGLQGDDARYWKTAALLKHFLANSNEDGREHSSSDFDERLWREYYAKAFEMAVKDGGARCLMAAYNAVNGTPAHVHPMLNAIVRGEWGVDGIVCTDGGGLRLLVEEHKAFPDLASGAAACLRAGINHFLDRHNPAVPDALARGLLTEADLDQALRGLFRISIRLGLLDPEERVPYSKIGAEGDPEPWAAPAARDLARRVTQKSIVLLRNTDGLLPLDKAKLKSIAIIGPFANTVLADWYSGTPPYAISPRRGIENQVALQNGQGSLSVNWVGAYTEAALELVRRQEVAVICVGNDPIGNAGWGVVSQPSEGKEAVDRRDLSLPPEQEEFVRRAVEANPRTIVVLFANFPYALGAGTRSAPALLQLTHASQELGNALGDVLFGAVNPGGKLVQTWPQSLAQLPPMMDYDLRHGRTYQYFRDEPGFPFGFGLSYTTFSLSNLRTSAASLRAGGSLQIQADLKNAGTREGDEVVQLYVRHTASAVPRPLKELRGFHRVTLAPGAQQTVTFELPASALAYWDAARHAWTLERDQVDVLVGTSSADRDLPLKTRLTVEP